MPMFWSGGRSFWGWWREVRGQIFNSSWSLARLRNLVIHRQGVEPQSCSRMCYKFFANGQGNGYNALNIPAKLFFYLLIPIPSLFSTDKMISLNLTIQEGDMPSQSNMPKGEILLYQTEDGSTRIDVRLQDETIWLTQAQMAELFQTTKQNVSLHVKNVFEEGELTEKGTVKDFLTVQKEGDRQVSREVAYYNLDVIISVGYRVKSVRGTQFRIWASQRLKEYLIKGFALDDERLKKAGGGNYFDELLSRIRDIRSSEKVFWRKVLDIYATSIDYTPNAEASQQFFKVVQNKMHWAAHGQTAAEVIVARADAQKSNMGLTSWIGDKLTRSDIAVAKNYLNHEELDVLNRLVSMYLDFAELQAKNRRPMYMKDWVTKLDDFLRLSEREILTHAGQVSNQQAIDKAHAEYDKYRALTTEEPSLVEQHFIEAVQAIKQLEVEHQKKEKE